MNISRSDTKKKIKKNAWTANVFSRCFLTKLRLVSTAPLDLQAPLGALHMSSSSHDSSPALGINCSQKPDANPPELGSLVCTVWPGCRERVGRPAAPAAQTPLVYISPSTAAPWWSGLTNTKSLSQWKAEMKSHFPRLCHVLNKVK